jgi:hypothetical protein
MKSAVDDSRCYFAVHNRVINTSRLPFSILNDFFPPDKLRSAGLLARREKIWGKNWKCERVPRALNDSIRKSAGGIIRSHLRQIRWS